MQKDRYRSYSKYLKETYRGKTYRIGVDAGFSCPNRGEDRNHPGCSFCDVEGSRAPYLGSLTNIEEQIRGGMEFLKSRYGATQFILYFQAYTSTYASPRQLKELYEYGLSLGTFKELIVSTRPDCIDLEKVEILSSFRSIVSDVWVELGLQSAQGETLKRINRGHGIAEFDRAFTLLRSRGIKICVHLIFGLPGEGWTEIETTVQYLARLRPHGIKIHNLHIPRKSPLFKEYLLGELSISSADRHLSYVIRALELLPEDTLVMRVTCDTPQERLAVPIKFPDKAAFLTQLSKRMEQENSWQGKLYNNPR